MTSIRKYASWVIGIALFVWAIFGTFSTLSRLGFVVDSLDWSANHAPLTVKTVALTIGKLISQLVTGYRALVHGLVQMLHLPKLPQLIYDWAGIAAFSMARGRWITNLAEKRYMKAYDETRAADRRRAEEIINSMSEADSKADRMRKMRELDFPFSSVMKYSLYRRASGIALRWQLGVLQKIAGSSLLISLLGPLTRVVAQAITASFYSGLVALVIAALFGIDYLYRHFA
jgi:hypothetical protein